MWVPDVLTILKYKRKKARLNLEHEGIKKNL